MGSLWFCFLFFAGCAMWIAIRGARDMSARRKGERVLREARKLLAGSEEERA